MEKNQDKIGETIHFAGQKFSVIDETERTYKVRRIISEHCGDVQLGHRIMSFKKGDVQ